MGFYILSQYIYIYIYTNTRIIIFYSFICAIFQNIIAMRKLEMNVGMALMVGFHIMVELYVRKPAD